MSNPISGILKYDGTIFMPPNDAWVHSHSAIAVKHGIPDGEWGDCYARFEVSPPGHNKAGDDGWRLFRDPATNAVRAVDESWVFRLDEVREPTWFADDRAALKDKCIVAATRWLSAFPENLVPGARVTAGHCGTATAGIRGTATVGDDGTATAGIRGTATAGIRGTATAGIRGTATAGDDGTATAGIRGTATVGDDGTATAGDDGTATAGIRGTATAGDGGTATAGDDGTATAGHYSTATAGIRGTATAGDDGTATAGDDGAATAGNCGTATAGHCGTATAGDYGAATAGDGGTATAGNRGTATAGDGGTIAIKRYDEKHNRYRLEVRYIGEGGYRANVKYRWDDARQQVVEA